MSSRVSVSDPSGSPTSTRRTRGESLAELSMESTKKAVVTNVSVPQFQLLMEKVGVMTCVARTGKGVKLVQQQMAKQADRAMIGQVRLMLNKFGLKIKNAMHAAGEPAIVGRFMDNGFGPFWKEVEKSLLDSFILETGFQFKEYRKTLGRHQAEAPSEPIEWARATLLHAMEPCDMSFWGRMRNPLYFLIFMTFLFPLYGVDSICVIVYWICQKKVDEFQLVNFIIKSKGLQFLTGGLMTGALGFTKLYMCSTAADPLGPTGCYKKGPGVTPTFRWEFSLLMFRSVRLRIPPAAPPPPPPPPSPRHPSNQLLPRPHPSSSLPSPPTTLRPPCLPVTSPRAVRHPAPHLRCVLLHKTHLKG